MFFLKRLNKEDLFSSKDLSVNLGEKSLHGGAITFLGQLMQILINFARIVVLSRLLTPQDFGIMNMVLVVIGFAAMLKDAGFSAALVQRKSVTHEQVSSLFWINVVICLLIAVVMILCAPVVSWFYSSPELTNVTIVMSFSFILSGMTLQHVALLSRHLHLGAITIINLVPQFVSLILTVCLAFLGWGYWALVAGVLSLPVIALPIILFYCPWRPGRYRYSGGVRDMLKFGGYITGFNIVNYFSRNADNILIGRFYGTEALGFYSRAYQMFMMPIMQIRGPIYSVAIPAMSAIRGDVKRYCEYYYRIVRLMCAIAIPMGIYFILEGPFVVKLVLGDNWGVAGGIFQILAFAGMIQPTIGTIGLVMISQGLAARYFRLGLINSVIICLAFVIGLPWGVIGVAKGYVVATWVVALSLAVFGLLSTPVSSLKFVSLHAVPLLGGTLAGVCSFFVRNYFSHNFLSHVLTILIFACVVVYLLFANSQNRDTVFRLLKSFGLFKKEDN